MKLHVAAVDSYALRWLIGRFLLVEPRAFEPLAQGNATIAARDGGECRSLVRASARAALLRKATSSVFGFCSFLSGFYLQIEGKSKWTRRDSNSWPPPCEGGPKVCRAFQARAKSLQIAVF
jgi:hypothetical protein